MSENWRDIYDHLDKHGLWIPAPWLERLVVSGADATTFLQSFCTNDVLRVPFGREIEAFFLNTKGHILHHGLLAVDQEQVVVYLIGSRASELMEHLARYVIREKVEFQVLDSRWWLAIGGPWESNWAMPESQESTPQSMADSRIHPFPLLYRPAWIIESTLNPERLELALKELGYRTPETEETGALVFDALRIESGLPLPVIDYGTGTLPQELDRNRLAIHFEKGCYLGQETVARLDALGHVNKLLRGICFAKGSSPTPGIAISRGGKEVGKVTSLMYSPRLGTNLGLAVIRREAAEEGEELTWAHGAARVVTLPTPASGPIDRP